VQLAPTAGDMSWGRTGCRVYGKVLHHSPLALAELAMPLAAWLNEFATVHLPATGALSVPPSVVARRSFPLSVKFAGAAGHKLRSRCNCWISAGRPSSADTDFRAAGWFTHWRGLRSGFVFRCRSQRRAGGDDLSRRRIAFPITCVTLITTLAGHVFKGKVPIAEGVEGVFVRQGGGQGIMLR